MKEPTENKPGTSRSHEDSTTVENSSLTGKGLFFEVRKMVHIDEAFLVIEADLNGKLYYGCLLEMDNENVWAPQRIGNIPPRLSKNKSSQYKKNIRKMGMKAKKYKKKQTVFSESRVTKKCQTPIKTKITKRSQKQKTEMKPFAGNQAQAVESTTTEENPAPAENFPVSFGDQLQKTEFQTIEKNPTRTIGVTEQAQISESETFKIPSRKWKSGLDKKQIKKVGKSEIPGKVGLTQSIESQTAEKYKRSMLKMKITRNPEADCWMLAENQIQTNESTNKRDQISAAEFLANVGDQMKASEFSTTERNQIRTQTIDVLTTEEDSKQKAKFVTTKGRTNINEFVTPGTKQTPPAPSSTWSKQHFKAVTPQNNPQCFVNKINIIPTKQRSGRERSISSCNTSALNSVKSRSLCEADRTSSTSMTERNKDIERSLLLTDMKSINDCKSSPSKPPKFIPEVDRYDSVTEIDASVTDTYASRTDTYASRTDIYASGTDIYASAIDSSDSKVAINEDSEYGSECSDAAEIWKPLRYDALD